MLLALLALLVALLCATVPGLPGAEPAPPATLRAVWIAEADGSPAGWRHVTFPSIDRATRYAVAVEGSRTILRGSADRSASMLVWEHAFDPREYPVLSWEWKLGGPLTGADPHHKATDDAPARVLVLFPEEPTEGSSGDSWLRRLYRRIYGEDLPTRGLGYVAVAPSGSPGPFPVPAPGARKKRWSHGGEAWFASAYTRHLMLLTLATPHNFPDPSPSAAQSAGEGEGRTAGWEQFQRDLEADYRAAFGQPLPARARLALMVDTDNTQQSTVSEFGALQVARR